MKIAFDVIGTLDGPRGNVILQVLKHCQKLGHECIVWSSEYGLARDFVKDNGLDVHFEAKGTKWNTEENDFYDFAIEDNREQGNYLAAKQFIFVDEIETAGWALKRMGLK